MHRGFLSGVGVLICFRVWRQRLERCQSTSCQAPVAVMLNLRADALTAACSGDYQYRRPTTGIKAAHCPIDTACPCRSWPHGQINCTADIVPSWRNWDCHQTFGESVPETQGYPRSRSADHLPWTMQVVLVAQLVSRRSWRHWQTAGGGSIPCWSARRLKTVDPPKGNGLGQKKTYLDNATRQLHQLSCTLEVARSQWAIKSVKHRKLCCTAAPKKDPALFRKSSTPTYRTPLTRISFKH